MRCLLFLSFVALTGCMASVSEAPPNRDPGPESIVCDCADAGAPDAGKLWACEETSDECFQVDCADWPQRACPGTGNVGADGGAGGQGGADGGECACHPWMTCTWTEPGCEHMHTSGSGGGG